MSTPADRRHDLYQQLFLAERSRREQIRGSIAVPVSAIAFSVYAFGVLATSVDLATWETPWLVALGALTVGAFISVLAGTVCLVRVEWLLVFDEMPDLKELIEAEDKLRAAIRERPTPSERALEGQYRDLLTGDYFIAYRRHFMSNGASARYRAWAVRFVVLGLLLLLLAFFVVPVHNAL